MTRHRKGLRPLSQTGLPRVPMNPHQRAFEEGGHKAKGTVLESFNEHSEDYQLHATKGLRNWSKRRKSNMSVKRGRAQMLVAEMLNGQGRPLHLQARFIREGY